VANTDGGVGSERAKKNFYTCGRDAKNFSFTMEMNVAFIILNALNEEALINF
jgi:hypothetical protein